MKNKNLLALVIVGTLLFPVTSATSSYIHERGWTISICDPSSNWTKCITMQDRNLWATTNDITSTGSYWYHFQWWNNHGFLPCLDGYLCQRFPWWERTWWMIDCGWYSPTTPLDDDVFRIWWYGDYCSSINDNLRWWSGDSQENNWWYDESWNVAINVEDRQWPCDTWYHVPSIWEWSQVLKYWAANYTWEWNELVVSSNDGISLFNTISNPSKVILAVVTRFQEDFKISLAGRRHYWLAWVLNVGESAYFSSSSPDIDNWYVRYLRLYSSGVYADDYGNRAYANSVRCFKNSYLSFPSNKPEVIVNIAEFNSWQNTCSGSNFIFDNISADKVDRDYELTWLYECAFGNGQSTTSVTLQLSGNLVAWWDKIFSGSNVKMKNSEWISAPAWLKFSSSLISTYQTLTATRTLFQKTWNMIWMASWIVTIQITVPAWTPNGKYNWTLVLTY